MNDTPNPLKGNPHYDLAYDRVVAAAATSEAGDEQVAQTEALMAQTEATLALAFEQRTANLQAVQKMTLDMLMNPNFDVVNKAEAAAEIDSLNDQINSRLGVEN